MSKYSDLVSIIDNLCNEAPAESVKYRLNVDDIPSMEQARSRGYIHMFLKAKFGILDFVSREYYLTDGPNDGGIDAYYIDKDNRKVYFIQSKFRNNDDNFHNKEISYEELLSMDISRIVEGELKDELGNKYNGKILQLQRDLQQIADLARYSYKVIILANLKEKIQSKLQRLIGRYEVEIFNHERVFNELVFPIISGTFYDAKELKITLIVNRDSGGSRIQYYPDTEYGNCTVNIQFVPTREIGRVMYQYKNSILKYNPRSFLEMQSGTINQKIAKSITDINTNEFSLLNNGITMLSDETIYSDRVGRKNTAELLLTNPQIINGGQTAYTLSKIYETHLIDSDFSVFDNKEVLLKVISFNDCDVPNSDVQAQLKQTVVESISIATNQQSTVTEADRRSNDKVQLELQQKIYETFGLYYERKRGEFSDGISKGYISRDQKIDREDFLRCCLAASLNPVWARQRGAEKLFCKEEFDKILPDSSNYRKYVYAYKVWLLLNKFKSSVTSIKLYARYSVVCVVSQHYSNELSPNGYDTDIKNQLELVLSKWNNFEDYVRDKEDNKNFYFHESIDSQTGEKRVDANWQGYYKGRTLIRDIKEYFEL